MKSAAEKIKELMAFLTPERLAGMLQEYRKVTNVYSLKMPDLRHLPAPEAGYNEAFQEIPSEIQLNYDLYLKSLNSPQPYFLGTPEVFENSMIFRWGESYEIDPQNSAYHFEVSRDWAFQKIVYEETILNLTSVTIDVLKPGAYFWRVTTTNDNGKIQYPFDVYMDVKGTPHSGMKYLIITKDGKVLEK